MFSELQPKFGGLLSDQLITWRLILISSNLYLINYFTEYYHLQIRNSAESIIISHYEAIRIQVDFAFRRQL
jgi:hypothetical protein